MPIVLAENILYDVSEKAVLDKLPLHRTRQGLHFENFHFEEFFGLSPKVSSPDIFQTPPEELSDLNLNPCRRPEIHWTNRSQEGALAAIIESE